MDVLIGAIMAGHTFLSFCNLPDVEPLCHQMLFHNSLKTISLSINSL